MDTLLSSGLRRASCFVDLFCNCLACVVVDGLRKFYDVWRGLRNLEDAWRSVFR